MQLKGYIQGFYSVFYQWKSMTIEQTFLKITETALTYVAHLLSLMFLSPALSLSLSSSSPPFPSTFSKINNMY